MSQPMRIELPFSPGEGTVNCYLFVEPEPVLIDAGFPSDEAWDALQAGLASHGLTPADLASVIITHPHVDHYGLAARLAATGRAEGRVVVEERDKVWRYRATSIDELPFCKPAPKK